MIRSLHIGETGKHAAKVVAVALACFIAVSFPFMGSTYGKETSSVANADRSTLSPLGTAGAVAETREEVIYANLTASGSVKEIYAVNLLHFTGAAIQASAETAGGRSAKDYGVYVGATNLTDTAPIKLASDGISFDALSKDFYYQGNLESKALPWNITINYKLDGKAISPANLGGKSGKLEATITATPAAVSTYTDNYMLQTTVTLDRTRCTNIDAPTAATAALGTDTILTFVTMPKSGGTYTFSADVVAFEMEGISVAAVPFSMSLGDAEQDVEDLKTGTDDLMEASEEIKDALIEVSTQLDSAGFSGMSTGLEDIDFSQLLALPGQLYTIADGVDQLASAAAVLASGFDAAYTALDPAIGALPVDTSTLVPVYTPGPTGDINTALTHAGTDAGLGTGTLDAADFAALQALAGEYASLGAAYGTTYTAYGQLFGDAVTASQTYLAVKPAFDGVSSGLPQITAGLGQTSAGLRAMADALQVAFDNSGVATIDAQVEALKTQLTTQLTQLSAGLKELSDGYTEFHDGLTEYTDGIKELTDLLSDRDFTPASFVSEKNSCTTSVQFVIKTDAIKNETVTEVADDETTEEEGATGFAGAWKRFTDLF
jgi:uncharacterized phage infection (PIP) family protein YhgE